MATNKSQQQHRGMDVRKVKVPSIVLANLHFYNLHHLLHQVLKLYQFYLAFHLLHRHSHLHVQHIEVLEVRHHHQYLINNQINCYKL